MILTHKQKIALAVAALLFPTLACRSAARLIIPDTPTPIPSPTLIPTFTPVPIPTATAVITLSCPKVTTDILGAAVYNQTGLSGKEGDSDADVTYLVDYRVDGDQIESPHFNTVSDKFQDQLHDRTTQEAIWSLFTNLIPSTWRTFVSEFVIFTDGRDNYLAAVNQADDDPKHWVLNVDIADASPKTVLTYDLLHEYGHLLTLNAEQVNVSLPVYKDPDNKAIQESEEKACEQYFTGEGCSKQDSYINTFFDRFWPYFYTEWQTIDAQDDKDKRERMLQDFYDTYQDQFLTDYAPTSPAEDIAESFAFFILSPRPENTSIANEKISFFYEYPELVDLRRQILNNICTEFQE